MVILHTNLVSVCGIHSQSKQKMVKSEKMFLRVGERLNSFSTTFAVFYDWYNILTFTLTLQNKVRTSV